MHVHVRARVFTTIVYAARTRHALHATCKYIFCFAQARDDDLATGRLLELNMERGEHFNQLRADRLQDLQGRECC